MMTSLQKLKDHLRRGKVYRRGELARFSNAVDRHLKELVDSGELTKLSIGLYYCPKPTAFGDAPPEESELFAAFLKDERFLLTSPNAFNALGVGATQLYSQTIVYNHKRHGQFNLGGRVFDFRVKASFPNSVSEEFLLVDLMNNLDHLAENRSEILDRVIELARNSNQRNLLRNARRYGSMKTRKFFAGLRTQTLKPNAR